eukprot:Sdes_comp10913_c0_seq1m2566
MSFQNFENEKPNMKRNENGSSLTLPATNSPLKEPTNENFLEKQQEKLSNWLTCFCVVTFDLELGQTLEMIYPNHVNLTRNELSNLCFMSFPDSNVSWTGDLQFCFRLMEGNDLKSEVEGEKTGNELEGGKKNQNQPPKGLNFSENKTKTYQSPS